MAAELTGVAVATSDLLFRSNRRRGNVMDTLRYIPGSAVRGALGARWVARHGLDEEFRAVFLSGRVRFHHARATIDGAEAFPVPLSFVTSKERPLEAHTFDLVTGRDRPDGVALRRVRGEVTADGVLRPGDGPPVTLRTRIATFVDEDLVADDPARGAGALQGLAAAGALFTETRLTAGTEFLVRVSGDAALVERLAERLLPADGRDELTVGRSRTVLGRTAVPWSAPTDVTPPGPTGDGEHVLMAMSDLVLLDPWGRAHVALGPEALAAMLGCDAKDVEVLPGGETRATEVGGWDGPNRMPTMVDRAIRAGSTVRFRAPEEAVRRLAVDPWIGWRRSEGYGMVAIDAPIHRSEMLRVASAAPGAAPSDAGADLAAAAQELVDGLAGRLGDRLRPIRWAQVVEAVRHGADLAAIAVSDEPTADTSKHSERMSGRGGGAGVRLRADRRAIAGAVLAAFERLELTGPELIDRRVELMVHAAREVRLRDLRGRTAGGDRA